MVIQNDELENVLREHINDMMKNMVLKSKTEEYWDYRKDENRIVTWYWDEVKCDWYFKDEAIRSKIIKNLRPIIDKIIEENKDLVNFFL